MRLLFAAVEIEIEGPHGWAERLPTWFRVTPLYARAYRLFMRGKPLTGYHLVMFILPLWSFHLGFVGGIPWSWAAEATTLADLHGLGHGLGFLVVRVQPALRLEAISPPRGVVARRHLDRTFPRRLLQRRGDLPAAGGIGALHHGTWTVLVNHAIFTAVMLGLTAVSSIFAPAYMRWHAYMRRPGSDERPLFLQDS